MLPNERYTIKNLKKWEAVTAVYVKANPITPSGPLEEKHLLDLDDTLISTRIRRIIESSTETTKKDSKQWIRPGLRNFLDRVKQFYELSLFTAATVDYAYSRVLEIPSLYSVPIFTRDDVIGYDWSDKPYRKPLSVAYQDVPYSSLRELEDRVKRNVLLFDDRQFNVFDEFRFNIIPAAKFLTEEIQKKRNPDGPVLLMYLPLLEYVAKSDDISETMEKLIAHWKESDVVEFIKKDLKADDFLKKSKSG